MLLQIRFLADRNSVVRSSFGADDGFWFYFLFGSWLPVNHPVLESKDW